MKETIKHSTDSDKKAVFRKVLYLLYNFSIYSASSHKISCGRNCYRLYKYPLSLNL